MKYQYKNGGIITSDISKLSVETNTNNRLSITDIVINKKGIVESGEFEVDGHYCKYENNKVSCTKNIVYTYSEILTSYNSSNYTYFFDKSYGLLRSGIQNLIFTNIKPSGTGHDVSANGDNSILLYFSLNGNRVKDLSNVEIDAYDVIIYSRNIILAPVDSKCFFAYLKNVNNLEFNERFDTRNVSDMSCMFWQVGETSMQELDLGNRFYTSNVVDMHGMFYRTGSEAMIELNLGSNFDTSNVINMEEMFLNTGHYSMTTLDLGDKFDTKNVKNMDSMFMYTGNSSMEELNLGNNFNTKNVTNMYQMFLNTGYSKMTALDLGDKFDTKNVKNMEKMFYLTGHYSMTTLDLGDKFDTSNVTKMSAMFACTGKYAMTTLDLGPLFKNIGTTNNFFETGKSGDCTIKVHEDIFNGENQFKLGKDSTTTIDYTRGRLQKSYFNTTTE